MKDFTLIKPSDIDDNALKLIDKDWMLITAGNMDYFNTMTASWGHLGPPGHHLEPALGHSLDQAPALYLYIH